MQPGQDEDISVVVANLDAIAAVINGTLDNSNISPSAAIVASKIFGYPSDGTKGLKGDGTWGILGSVDYKGPWDVAFAYSQGDVVTYQGVTYLAVNPGTGQTPSPLGQSWTLGVGTTLPASPVDTQEYILVDSVTLPTYAWHFKYFAGISDANKWVFIGGSSGYSVVDTNELTNSTSYVALTTAGPSFTVPRAGVYLIDIGFTRLDANIGNGYMGFDVGATGAIDADAALAGHNHVSLQKTRQKTIAAASTALVAKYRVDSSSTNYQNRWMRVTPVRVA